MEQQREGFIELENGSLHYQRWGSGGRVLLAFHGYGSTAALFSSFGTHLGQEFTILSFDLPHHGKSQWPPDNLVHKADLQKLVSAVRHTYGVNKVSLAGYSMGGRVCLTLTELMPESIDQVLLIAPDGLVFNPLYYFVTRTLIGRRIFRSFLTTPQRYHKLVDWMHSRRWIDPSRYKFAMHYLGSETDRRFLLQVWPSLSLIVPNMTRLRKGLKTHRIRVFIFMGMYDRIIPVPHATRFRKTMPGVKLFVLEKGHRVFDADTLPKMADCLIHGTC